MAFGCGATCAKYILFVFNFIFWLAGAGLLGLGLWFTLDPNISKMLQIAGLDGNLNATVIRTAGYVLIGVGGFIFFVGFLGCCGACQESVCLLWMYAFLLVIILIIQIAAGILAAVFRGKIGESLKTAMLDAVKSKYDGSSPISASWDAMQIQFSCCGANDPHDWDGSRWQLTNPLSVIPTSCCVPKDKWAAKPEPVDVTQCRAAYILPPIDPNRDKYLHTKGCYPSFSEWLKRNATILLAVAFGLAGIQFFGILFACCVIKAIKRENSFHSNKA